MLSTEIIYWIIKQSIKPLLRMKMLKINMVSR
nr:MAG TPA: hypothetical protein [Bacteriophage sp.]